MALLVALRGGLPPVEDRNRVSRLMLELLPHSSPKKEPSLTMQTAVKEGVMALICHG